MDINLDSPIKTLKASLTHPGDSFVYGHLNKEPIPLLQDRAGSIHYYGLPITRTHLSLSQLTGGDGNDFLKESVRHLANGLFTLKYAISVDIKEFPFLAISRFALITNNGYLREYWKFT